MKVIGYTYPDGFALCIECAMKNTHVQCVYSPEEIHPIFDTDEIDGITCDDCLEVIE
jgi:hypothetical protein